MQSAGSGERLAELCEEEQVEEEISAEQQEDEKIVRNGDLHMTRLVYGYQQESGTKRLYERKEAVWKAGEKILIKGENGSGKIHFFKSIIGNGAFDRRKSVFWRRYSK